jgi:hypothetical protein
LHVVGVVIAKNSGAVTSMPTTNPIVFEVRRGSPLPELLAECGYDVIQVGEAERLMPITEVLTEQGTTTKITRQHVGPPRSQYTNSNCRSSGWHEDGTAATRIGGNANRLNNEGVGSAFPRRGRRLRIVQI